MKIAISLIFCMMAIGYANSLTNSSDTNANSTCGIAGTNVIFRFSYLYFIFKWHFFHSVHFAYPLLF